jgi:membrane associated rhomboid family serine protease
MALVKPPFPFQQQPLSLSEREPILNVPGVVTVLCGLMIAIHAVREFLLGEDRDREVLLTFAFIPSRFERSLAGSWGFPGGAAADVWTFVTYAFLHADWTHLGVNVLWLLVFGSAVARRFGALRSLSFFAVTAAAGALGHLAAVGTAFVPVIGASAAVSGFTAAALRFVFQMGGPLGAMRQTGEEAYRMPALGLGAMLRNGPVMGMVVVWIAVNVAFGAISLPIPGFEGQIAWQAHLAGFAAGLLLFRFFDPVARA